MQSILTAVVILFSFACSAEPVSEAVAYLQEQWAIDNYQLSGKEQKESFLSLIEVADKKVSEFPQSAEVYIWRGIIESTYAGVKGGLGAMKYAKLAKADLEMALSLDDRALSGSAYTSLGTLYFNVPGWPIGFGNGDKAEELLKTALEINPDGIDPNYFYGDYLRDEKRYTEAKRYLHRALLAKPRPGRELADDGRRRDIQRVLEEVEKHL